MNELQSKYPDRNPADPGQIPARASTLGGHAAAVPGPARIRLRRPRRHVQEIAEIIGLSTTDVDALVGFYTLYHDQPAGRYRVQVCTDLPCALRGADEFLAQAVRATWAFEVGETTPDGLFTIEAVTCLAGCHRAPLFQVQGDGEISYHENQTVETALALVTELRAAAADKEAGHGG